MNEDKMRLLILKGAIAELDEHSRAVVAKAAQPEPFIHFDDGRSAKVGQ